MNTLYLEPNDVLFFRDGRPMSGSLSGHGAAWPLPTVINAALHAALHRASIDGQIKDDKGNLVKVHGHDHRCAERKITDVRKFGSLLTAGPFPVSECGKWLFPRPLDANIKNSTAVSFLPLAKDFDRNDSSLPIPLKYAVANEEKATKDKPADWWSANAWQAYLNGSGTSSPDDFKTDSSFSDHEFTYGIGIDPDTNTQKGEQFYSASYLRLKPRWKLGILAEAWDKIDNDCSNKRDLIKGVFPNSGNRTHIIAGGQQRVCTVERPSGEEIKLPIGKSDGFKEIGGKHLVKWVLLTPAIFPRIEKGISKRGTERKEHRGGWLPSWINPENGHVLLETISAEERNHRRKLNAQGKGYVSVPNIDAHLVAALTEKPLLVTGYALANDADPERKAGAKSTHLAVPAGSVYYFECTGPEAAKALAAALNWHGGETENPTTIKNRRSTLMGEKGFGLGVCGTWHPHGGELPIGKTIKSR